jgi:amino acid adenylation domain-containing protein
MECSETTSVFGVPLPYPHPRLEQIFSAQAKMSPQSIAVVALDKRITYRELDRRANRLAHRLQSLGVTQETLVGLYLDRGIELIVGLLGILKAGAAYLPLDVHYPETRLAFLVTESNLGLVVTSSERTASLCAAGINCLCIDADDPIAWEEESSSAPKIYGTDTHLAYVIYTSGSTGNPKGVMIEHRSVIRLFEQTHRWYSFESSDTWTMFHSIGFDFSVWEIWGALLFGGRLVIVPQDGIRLPTYLLRLLRSEGVTILNQTPTAFRMLMNEVLASSEPDTLALRFVILGGEALDPATLVPWVTRYGDRQPQLVNMYGITETTVHVTHKRMRESDTRDASASPIGKPIPDLTVQLLDPAGQPVVDGTPGEIYITGPGLARGYLNRPELTTERFQDSIVPDGIRRRWYRSGDRALRTQSGELFYLGRYDDQIKVRGYRIDPQEIESYLVANAGVAACAVMRTDCGNDDIRLLAYIVLPTNTAWNLDFESALRRTVATGLPEHLRPASYIVVPSLPVTIHGKVDRDALTLLPGIVQSHHSSSASFDKTQGDILEIWKSVLNRQDLDPRVEFFDQGGTSLTLVRMLNSLVEVFSLDFDDLVSSLEGGVNIADLAQYVVSKQGFHLKRKDSE